MSEDTPQSPSPVDDSGSSIGQLVWGLIILAIMVVVIFMTSAPPTDSGGDIAVAPAESAPPDTAAPAEQSPPPEESAPPPPSAQPADDLNRAEVAITTLADEQAGWLTITGQSSTDQGSTAQAIYRKDNEFMVNTSNVNRFEIDLADLSVNRTRRFIMHIDGQDMLLFPKRLDVIRFTRTAEGTWTYQRKD